jgi:hypothetical protein
MAFSSLNHLDMPAFTIPLGTSKTYIITSPQLVQSVYKSKVASTEPLVTAFAEKMVGFGPNLGHLMRHPPTDGSMRWLHDQDRNYSTLAPGPALYEMNVRVLESLSADFNTVGASFETKKLYLWLRDTFTTATTKALFGLDNPLIKDPALCDDLWYEKQLRDRL